MTKTDRNKFLLVAVCILALSACAEKEPHWKHVCVEDHIEIIMIPTVISRGKTTSTIMRPQPIVHCDQREWQCIVPEGAESDECPPLEEK